MWELLPRFRGQLVELFVETGAVNLEFLRIHDAYSIPTCPGRRIPFRSHWGFDSEFCNPSQATRKLESEVLLKTPVLEFSRLGSAERVSALVLSQPWAPH